MLQVFMNLQGGHLMHIFPCWLQRGMVGSPCPRPQGLILFVCGEQIWTVQISLHEIPVHHPTNYWKKWKLGEDTDFAVVYIK